MGRLNLGNEASVPTPDSGNTRIFVDSTSKLLNTTDDAGTVVEYGPASGVNSFETVNCPAGTDPVADSSTDTLNFTSADASITITGNSSTDTVDFSAPVLSPTWTTATLTD